MNQVFNIEVEVELRKYEVDKERLIQCLQDHRKPPQEVADKLGKPKTLVEHWFRKDKYFAIPDADVWFQLKELLGIETTEFDESITTFETRGGCYDIRNRIYAGDISPTLNTNSGNFYYLLENDDERNDDRKEIL